MAGSRKVLSHLSDTIITVLVLVLRVSDLVLFINVSVLVPSVLVPSLLSDRNRCCCFSFCSIFHITSCLCRFFCNCCGQLGDDVRCLVTTYLCNLSGTLLRCPTLYSYPKISNSTVNSCITVNNCLTSYQINYLAIISLNLYHTGQQ